MINHLHMILNIKNNKVYAWSSEEIAQRWLQLFPKDSPEFPLYCLHSDSIILDVENMNINNLIENFLPVPQKFPAFRFIL